MVEGNLLISEPLCNDRLQSRQSCRLAQGQRFFTACTREFFTQRKQSSYSVLPLLAMYKYRTFDGIKQAIEFARIFVVNVTRPTNRHIDVSHIS